VPISRAILIALICASPASLLWNDLITQGIIAGIIAVALAISALTLRPGETNFLISVIRPWLVIAAIPALWIALQALPLRAFAHPIWQSAGAALGYPIAGAISVDPGATVLALGQYLSLAAVALLSAAVGVDRQRAESILIALTAAATATALIMLSHDLLLPGDWLSGFAHAQALNCATMGMIIAGSSCIRTIERQQSRQSSPQQGHSLRPTFLASAGALLICLVAVLVVAPKEALFATAYGFLALVAIIAIRRFDLRLLGTLGIVLPALGAAILLIGAHPTERAMSVTLDFAGQSPLVSLTERILDDAPLVGTGAGTFAAIAPLYRDMNDPSFVPVAATAAASFAIELGQPVLWLIVVATVGAIILLLRASLQRGRDSFYAAMGGSSLLALLLLAFNNAGLLGTATGLMIAAVLGLAAAQSKSRTLQH
jgi:hypothetical protein